MSAAGIHDGSVAYPLARLHQVHYDRHGMRAILGFALLLLALAGPSRAQVVDHRHLAAVASFPQSVLDAIGGQRWLFTHASVGANIVDGLVDLHGLDAARYQLVTTGIGFDSGLNRAEAPPAATLPGTVYECQRGNPGWSEKVAIFDNSVRLAGWRLPKVDVVMDKFCYIDPDADANVYMASMTALRAAYPTTAVVYTTMPLTTDEDADNVLRNQFNQAVRAHCASTGAVLFDVADMEAYDPNGVAQTFTAGGHTWQKLYAGYSDDGGHLNVTGRQRIATGWYAVAAVLVDHPIFWSDFEQGTTAGWIVQTR